MLFPRALGAGPRTAIYVVEVDDACRVSWLGATAATTTPAGFDVAGQRPGLPAWVGTRVDRLAVRPARPGSAAGVGHVVPPAVRRSTTTRS